MEGGGGGDVEDASKLCHHTGPASTSRKCGTTDDLHEEVEEEFCLGGGCVFYGNAGLMCC